MTHNAYFLWVGGPIPDMARVSVLSAAEAGFDTVLFTDRDQPIKHPALRAANWREIGLPWTPEEVYLKGKEKPYFAGFANLFRYRLLSLHSGWWFDCDTVVLKERSDFDRLLIDDTVVLGFENSEIVNNAVIGANNPNAMQRLYEAALPHYPAFETWGITGPKLMTHLHKEGTLPARVMPPSAFYPVHHNDIARVYLPDQCDCLRSQEHEWYCLSLWNEVLLRSGLAHLSPPPDSYLGDLLARRPELGGIVGNPTRMAAYLAENLRRLDDMDSGRLAMKTLLRKAGVRFSRRRAIHDG